MKITVKFCYKGTPKATQLSSLSSKKEYLIENNLRKPLTSLQGQVLGPKHCLCRKVPTVDDTTNSVLGALFYLHSNITQE